MVQVDHSAVIERTKVPLVTVFEDRLATTAILFLVHATTPCPELFTFYLELLPYATMSELHAYFGTLSR